MAKVGKVIQSLCLNCACVTKHRDNDMICLNCNRKKDAKNTPAALKLVLDARFPMSAKKRAMLYDRYDLKQVQASKYAKSIRTADEIPNEKGRIS